MKELLATLEAWLADGLEVGRAVVIRTYGSAPRRAGSVLLHSSDGRILGSVSGGCVEGAAAEEIARARESGLARTVRYGVTDEQAWSVGLACGGTIDVLVEPSVPAEVADAAGRRDGAVVITPLPDDRGAAPMPKLLFDAGGLRGTTGDAATDAALVAAASDALLRGESRVLEPEGRRFFVEAFPIRPRLVIVGAVEIARPLVRLARELGYATLVIDGRHAFVTRERFPDADQLQVGWFDELADRLGVDRDDSVVVLTHDPKFDEPAIAEALRRGCRYVGAIGSRRTQAERRQRLLAAGLSDAEVDQLHGPIGLDLGGRAPAETALAILAEVVAMRYGASGQELRTRST